jgi:hypothetical protein
MFGMELTTSLLGFREWLTNMVDKMGVICIEGNYLPLKGNPFTLECPPLYRGGFKETTSFNSIEGKL